MWPDKSKFANAINIPEELKKRLDIPWSWQNFKALNQNNESLIAL
jgi:hypothetical protein